MSNDSANTIRHPISFPYTRSYDHQRSRDWPSVFFCFIAFVCLFYYYCPPLPAIEDEIGFYNQAVLWSQGKLHSDTSNDPGILSFLPIRGKLTGWRNPGRSLTLIPFLWAGCKQEIFWSGCVIHLITTLILARTLVVVGNSPLWSILYLFHPTSSLYSRTLMSDELGGMFVAATLLSMISNRRGGMLSGLLLGAAIICRYQIAVLFPFAAWAIFRQSPYAERRRNTLQFIVTTAGIGVLLCMYNWYALDNPIGPTSQGVFGAQYVPKNFGYYTLSLTVLWPGMLPIALFCKSSPIKAFCLSLSLPLLVLLICYYYFDIGTNDLQTLVLGQRLMLPALPAFVVIYAVNLKSWTNALRARHRVVSLVLCTFAITAAIGLTALEFDRHERHLNRYLCIRNMIAERIPAGASVFGDQLFYKLFCYDAPEVPKYRILTTPPIPLGQTASGAGFEWYSVNCHDKAPLAPIDEHILRQHSVEQQEVRTDGVYLTLLRLTPARTTTSPATRELRQ